MKLKFLPLLGAVAMAAAPSQAAITITAMEMDGNVIFATDGGALDLSAWTFQNVQNAATAIAPSGGVIQLASGDSDVYVGAVNFVAPSPFGSGAVSFASDSSITDNVGILSVGGLIVPLGYQSNDPIAAGSMTFAGDYGTLGITPGTYTWSWGNAEMQTADTFTLEVKPSSVPDGGSTALLGAIAFGSLAGIRRWLRRGVN